MSQENVEALRAAMDAFNRRDGEAFGAFLGEDAEIVPVRAVVDGQCSAVLTLPWSTAPLSRQAGGEPAVRGRGASGRRRMGPRAGTHPRPGARKWRCDRCQSGMGSSVSRRVDHKLPHVR
jgi:hypothetical protein